MPSNRFFGLKVSSDADIAFNLTATPANNGAYTAPFTDDGSDTTLNEDYSSAATDARITATRPTAIHSIVFDIEDSDIPQNQLNDHEFWVGGLAALTNGLKFKVTNSAGTTLLDISVTVPIVRVSQLDGLCIGVYESYSSASATTASNYHTYAALMDFTTLFGKSIVLNTGDKFVCVLNDDFTGLAVFSMRAFGFYL